MNPSLFIKYVACWVLLTLSAWAWGPGHVIQTETLLQLLPEGLRQHLTPEIEKRAAQEWSLYPDSFAPFDATLTGERGLAVLAADKIKVRYDLHSERGRAVAFQLLVAAIQEEDYPRVFFWIACLSHSVGDMVAVNHATRIHVATYDWEGIDLPGGVTSKQLKPRLDLAWLKERPDGRAQLTEAIRTEWSRLERGPVAGDEALLRIMMYGYDGGPFLTRIDAPLLSAAVGSFTSSQARDALARLLADSGAWGAARVLRDVETAMQLARTGTPPVLTPAVEDKWTQRVAEMAARIEIYVDQPPPPLAETATRIGLLFEPHWQMSESMFGPGAPYDTFAIAGTLNARQLPWQALDLMRVVQNGLPEPATMPVLILAAQHFNSLRFLSKQDFVDRLERWLGRGGKLLWLNGVFLPPSAVSAQLPLLTKSGEKAKWPGPLENISGILLEWTGGPAPMSWTLRRTPETPAGWQRPRSPFVFDAANVPSADQLLWWHDGSASYLVGVAGRQVALLPIYAVHPFLWGTPVNSPVEDRLDTAGEALLLAVLNRLHPALLEHRSR